MLNNLKKISTSYSLNYLTTSYYCLNLNFNDFGEFRRDLFITKGRTSSSLPEGLFSKNKENFCELYLAVLFIK